MITKVHVSTEFYLYNWMASYNDEKKLKKIEKKCVRSDLWTI